MFGDNRSLRFLYGGFGRRFFCFTYKTGKRKTAKQYQNSGGLRENEVLPVVVTEYAVKLLFICLLKLIGDSFKRALYFNFRHTERRYAKSLDGKLVPRQCHVNRRS